MLLSPPGAPRAERSAAHRQPAGWRARSGADMSTAGWLTALLGKLKMAAKTITHCDTDAGLEVRNEEIKNGTGREFERWIRSTLGFCRGVRKIMWIHAGGFVSEREWIYVFARAASECIIGLFKDSSFLSRHLSDLASQTVVLFNTSGIDAIHFQRQNSGFVSLTCCYGYTPFYRSNTGVCFNSKTQSNDPFLFFSLFLFTKKLVRNAKKVNRHLKILVGACGCWLGNHRLAQIWLLSQDLHKHREKIWS